MPNQRERRVEMWREAGGSSAHIRWGWGGALYRKSNLGNEIVRPCSQSYIHVSVSDLYIPWIGLPILL
jgi:hypothetical protein